MTDSAYAKGIPQLFRGLPLLQNGEVILRELSLEDVDPYFHFWQHPEKTMGNLWTRASDWNDAWSLLLRLQEHYQSKRKARWALVEMSSSRIVGEIGLEQVDENHKVARLVFASFATNGYTALASKGIALLKGYAGDIGIRRLEALMPVHKTAAIHVLAENGFEQEAILKQCIRIGRHYHDAALLTAVRS